MYKQPCNVEICVYIQKSIYIYKHNIFMYIYIYIYIIILYMWSSNDELASKAQKSWSWLC